MIYLFKALVKVKFLELFVKMISLKNVNQNTFIPLILVSFTLLNILTITPLKKMVYILQTFMKKTKSNFLIKIIFLQLLLILIFSSNSFAYIGLGPLLPVIGSIVAYIFIGIITLFGFVIYPFRLILKKMKNKKLKNEINKKN